MLHRSLGILAATPFQVLIASAKDPICTNLSTRLVIQIFTDSRPFPTFEFNFDREKHMQVGIFQLAMAQSFCHVLLLLLGYLSRRRFFPSLLSPAFLAP